MARTFLDVINLEHTYNPAEFKEQVLKQLWTIHYWTLGQELFDALGAKATGILFDTKLWIKYHRGACDYREDKVLYYDPKYFFEKEFEPTQQTVIRSDKTYVYLFHKLVHFYHSLVGTFRATTDEELHTVGLYQYATDRFSENALRQQAKLPRRPCYTWKSRSDNAARYEEEKKRRLLLRLPEQTTLTWNSRECQF